MVKRIKFYLDKKMLFLNIEEVEVNWLGIVESRVDGSAASMEKCLLLANI